MSPIRLFMYVLWLILFFVFIFIAAQMFMSFRMTIETRHLDRFATQMEENIFSSPLTVNRAVFNADELNKYASNEHKALDNAGMVVGGEEPYTRHCKYGYGIEIENTEDGNTWKFGFSGTRNPILESAAVETPVEIAYPKADGRGYDIRVGKMKLKVSHTWLSEITCLIEDAWSLKAVQKTQIPCLKLVPAGACGIPIRRSPKNTDYICLFSIFTNDRSQNNDVECRYLPGIPLDTFDKSYTPSSESGGVRILKAIPIKASPDYDIASVDCTNFDDKIATPSDSVDKVILCLGGGPVSEKTKEEESKPSKWNVCKLSVTAPPIDGKSTEFITLTCKNHACDYGETLESATNSLGECRTELRNHRKELTDSGYTVESDNADSTLLREPFIKAKKTVE